MSESTNKVLIIGAHGKIGQILSKKLAEHDQFEPTAFIRKKEQKATFDEMGVESVIANLQDSVADLSETLKGFDAVVFTAGAGGKGGLEKTLEIDLDGAVKSMEAAEESGVQRYILVSASHADDRSFWEKSGIKAYYIAKHYADEKLRVSNLDYTILRPVKLLDESGTGQITASKNPDDVQAEIPREDVATSILQTLLNDQTIHKTIELSKGNDKFADAFNKIS
jgi:uncharacterized protein YbjT (DUF2867 family)